MEIEYWDLPTEVKDIVYDIHGSKNLFLEGDRILYGWYERDGVKVKFYYRPSFLSRQRMYWIHGWKWIDVDETKAF